MVTKPTGRPRGRPRKPARPKPQRGVGRPKLDFRQYRYRYAIALLDAMLALDMASANACAKAVATWQVGIELDPAKLSADGLYVITNWKAPPARVVHTSPGASAATLEGRAATLREKLRRYRSEEEAIWRRQMASAFMVTLGARDRERCKAAVLERCQQIGEDEFARTVLWPMIDAKIDAKVGARTLARFSG